MLQRILSVTIKEFLQLRRDRRTMAMIVILPLIQLILFGYALTSDIKNIPLVVWDNSHSVESRELIRSFTNQDLFSLKYYCEQLPGYLQSNGFKLCQSGPGYSA